MTNDRVTIEVADGIADVTLNRPDKLNALDRAMFTALSEASTGLAKRDDVRVVVLSGGGRAFCAGLDLAAMAGDPSFGLLDERSYGIANVFQNAAWGWRSLPVPVIAAIHGVAFGGGLQIALGADIRIVAPDAKLAVMEARWGLVPDMAGIALLRGLVRDDVARELTYTARQFSGTEAVRPRAGDAGRGRPARRRHGAGGRDRRAQPAGGAERQAAVRPLPGRRRGRAAAGRVPRAGAAAGRPRPAGDDRRARPRSARRASPTDLGEERYRRAGGLAVSAGSGARAARNEAGVRSPRPTAS